MPFTASDNINAWLSARLEDNWDDAETPLEKIHFVQSALDTDASLRVFAAGALLDVCENTIFLQAVLNTIDLQWVRRTFIDWAAAAILTESGPYTQEYCAELRSML